MRACNSGFSTLTTCSLPSGGSRLTSCVLRSIFLICEVTRTWRNASHPVGVLRCGANGAGLLGGLRRPTHIGVEHIGHGAGNKDIDLVPDLEVRQGLGLIRELERHIRFVIRPFTVTWRLAWSIAVTCVVTWLSSASLAIGISAAYAVKLAADASVAKATARARERIGS